MMCDLMFLETSHTLLTSGLEMMSAKCSEDMVPLSSRTSPPCSELCPLSTSNLFTEESVMRERIYGKLGSGMFRWLEGVVRNRRHM